MELKDFQDALNGLKEQINTKGTEISDVLKAEFEAKLAKVEEAYKENETKGAEKIAELEGQIAKLAEKNKKPAKAEAKNFDEQLMNAFEEKKSELDSLKEKSGSVSFEIKSPINVGLSNTLFAGGSASQVQITDQTGIISPIRDRVQVYLQNVSVGATNGAKVMWTEELDEQGNVLSVAELATKPNISVRYEEREINVKKYAAWTKVSTEMLSDAPQLASALQTNVLKRLNLKIEKDLFVGPGTTTTIAGISTYATAFTGGTLAGQVADANDYDVIRAIALQVQEANGVAGAIFITPAKLAEMDIQKGEDGQYVLPPFRAEGGNVVAGVRLIPTNALIGEAIDFVGGDLSVVNVRFNTSVRLEMDRSGDDFINNRMTLLAEARLAQFVSANDVQVLVKGTFAAAKAELAPA